MNKNCHFVPLILSSRLNLVFSYVAVFFFGFLGFDLFFHLFIGLFLCFFLFLVRDVMFVSLIS